jgi:hypothetical protein
MIETHEHRLIVHISDRERDLIAQHHHGQRIGSRAEAVRQILAAGFEKLGLVASDMAPAPLDSTATGASPDPLPAPVIPNHADCGRPVLGELILPWLRTQGRREYEENEVLVGVFGEQGARAVGREAVLRKCFAAIGWRARTSRLGGVTKRTFHPPD